MTPPAAGRTAWTETTVVSFDGANGSYPNGGLISDAKGNLYGTTYSGGRATKCPTNSGAPPGCGTVFRLTPPAAGKTTWTETILTSFNANIGYPAAGVIFGATGKIYGTTQAGGRNNNGTVFELVPPAAGKIAWTETILTAFVGTKAFDPVTSLTFDAAGNLYGTTYAGGSSNDGTVFKLKPPKAGKTAWTTSLLLSFNAAKGAYPEGPLISDAAGNLYGTTSGGGAGGTGTVFKLTPPATGKNTWTETVLAYFRTANGLYPEASLIFDSNGNIYGTTSGGGTSNAGTIFKLMP